MSGMPAVLFVVFNRPDTTKEVFAAIRAARPARLYVAADGPRAGRADEARRCDEVRAIATAVDWPCEFKTLFRDHNLGCKNAVADAIDWFFAHESEGIILEDDCLPDPTFFRYCTELLDRYRDDTRVMCISAQNFAGAEHTVADSYYYSRHVHIWGWASWRRAWRHYSRELRESRDEMRKVVTAAFPASPAAHAVWLDILDRVGRGEIDTWDFQWFYACWRQSGLTCIPQHNLVTNIGFGPDATHTFADAGAGLDELRTAAMHFPLSHPAYMVSDVAADRRTDRNRFGIGLKRSPVQMAHSALRRLTNIGARVR